MTMINIYNPLERKYLDETITTCNEYMLKVKVKDQSLTHTFVSKQIWHKVPQ